MKSVPVDIFLAHPIVVDVPLPDFDAEQMRFAYRVQLDYANSDRLLLEEVFRMFNIKHPQDYRNRSFSVGDVVMIDETRSYRCDWTDWVPLSCELKRKLPATENA
jgi:hypothetical protein